MPENNKIDWIAASHGETWKAVILRAFCKSYSTKKVIEKVKCSVLAEVIPPKEKIHDRVADSRKGNELYLVSSEKQERMRTQNKVLTG